MLMRLFWGACIFSLGYYIGRETAQNNPGQHLSTKKDDFLKGDFTDVEDENNGKNEKN